MDHPFLWKILHQLGILKFLHIINELYDFNLDMVTSHKQRDIDGDNPLTFTEAMLHKIQQTPQSDNPFHGKIGELNLLSVLLDLFLAGSGMLLSQKSIEYQVLFRLYK